MSKKVLCLTFVGLLSLAAIAGCAPSGRPVPGQATQQATRAQPVTLTLPGEDWGYPSPFSFYPRGPGYLRMSLIFDTLVWKDESRVIPWLAEDWRASEDGTRWTFTLRSGVHWHDGRDLTVDDVVFSYNYFRAHLLDFRWNVSLDKVDRAEAAGERTVVIVLSEPLGDFLPHLAGSLPIIPRHIWEAVEEPAKFSGPEAVVGSGPFKLLEYSKEEERYLYEANLDHFAGRPVIDRLQYGKVGSAALALKTGAVDAASFSGKEIEAVNELMQEGDLACIEGPSYWVLQLIFNPSRPPFDRREARLAVAHAVDRAKIVRQVTHGGAVVANLGIISPDTAWHNPNLPSYAHDPLRAKALLEQAGLEGCQVTLLTTGDYAREAELIKADLQAAGFGVEVRSVDRGTLDGLLGEGRFDLALNGHGGIANPATLKDPGWPATVYQNPDYGQLFVEQGRTLDEEKRRQLVWRLQEMVAEDLPVLTLYHPRSWCVYNPAVLDTWFYTTGGISIGIPSEQNKLVFLPE